MNFSFFLPHFPGAPDTREAAAPKASGCFMGGTYAVWEEPGKQNPRSCRAQELVRSSAQEKERQKKGWPIELAGRAWVAKAGQLRLRGEVSSQLSVPLRQWISARSVIRIASRPAFGEGQRCRLTDLSDERRTARGHHRIQSAQGSSRWITTESVGSKAWRLLRLSRSHRVNP